MVRGGFPYISYIISTFEMPMKPPGGAPALRWDIQIEESCLGGILKPGKPETWILNGNQKLTNLKQETNTRLLQRWTFSIYGPCEQWEQYNWSLDFV